VAARVWVRGPGVRWWIIKGRGGSLACGPRLGGRARGGLSGSTGGVRVRDDSTSGVTGGPRLSVTAGCGHERAGCGGPMVSGRLGHRRELGCSLWTVRTRAVL
jgi:hypothetical protein